jgi:site-specific DNA-adenine methylase
MQVIVPERVPTNAVVYCDPPYLMSHASRPDKAKATAAAAVWGASQAGS